MRPYRKQLAAAYFLLCSLQGAWAFFWLAGNPREPGQWSLLTASPMRLALLVAAALLVLVFAGLAGREIFGHPENSLVDRLLAQRELVVASCMLFLAGLCLAWVFVFSPLRIERLAGYYQRWRPLFIWFALVAFQFYGLGFILYGSVFWRQAWRDLGSHPYLVHARQWIKSPGFCLALIGLGFLLGLTKLVFGQFVDEGDNLSHGWLISKGYLLYRDLFSSHFPFAYYWSALIISLFGKSQAVARVSLLVLQAVVFSFSAWQTRLFLPVGLTALVWGLTSHFHRGNLVLYDTFDGIFLTNAFILSLSLLIHRTRATRLTLGAIGLFLGCALLSNPLMIFPAAVTLFFLFLSGLEKGRKAGIREGFRLLKVAGGIIGIVLGFYLLTLLLSGTLQDFYRNAIWFNANIYNQYVDGGVFRLSRIGYQLVSGLDIFNPQWRQLASPVIDFGVERFRVAQEELYYSWIFSSLLFRLSILACTLGLLLQRKFLAGSFLYVFSATLLARADTSWHAIPFIWLSLFAGAYFLTNLARPLPVTADLSLNKKNWRYLTWGLVWRAAYAGLLVLYAWSALSGGIFLFNHRQALSDDRYLKRIARFGDEIRRLTCNQPGVEFLEYPFEPMVYLVTGIPPASRYTFLHPSDAQVGLSEVMEDLLHHPSAVVEVKAGKRIWIDYEVNVYLADLIAFLNQNYHPVTENLWMSRELAQNCQVGEPQIPPEEEIP